MALILPTPGAQSSTGKLLIPGVTPQEEIERVLGRRAKLLGLQQELKAAKAEAGRPTAARFLEELGIVGRETGQSIARSLVAPAFAGFAAASGKFTQPTKREITPRSGLERAVFGEKPFSLQSVGEEYAPLLELAGVSRETTKRFAVPIALFGFALDILPFPGGKKAVEIALRRAAVNISKTTEHSAITKELAKIVKGDKKTIDSLATALVNVTNPEDAYKIIQISLKDSKMARAAPKITLSRSQVDSARAPAPTAIPERLRGFAEKMRETGIGKSAFLKELGETLKSQNLTRRGTAENVMKAIREAGLTPGSFYDAVHGVRRPRVDVPAAPPRSVGEIKVTPSAIRETIRPSAPFIRRNEYTLLKQRVRDLSAAARKGAVGTRTAIKAMQRELHDIVRENLPPALRGAATATIRSALTSQTFENALDTVSRMITRYENLQAQRKVLSTLRQKKGWVQKAAQLNQTAVTDAKKALGIEVPLRKMDEGQLNRLIEELEKRLQFKFERGLIETEKKALPGRLDPELAERYHQAQNKSGRLSARFWKGVENLKAVFKEPGDLILVASEALRNIGAEPVLTALRKMGHTARMKQLEGEKVLIEIVDKLGLNRKFGQRAISDRDLSYLDLAMKNGNIDTVMEIAERYGVRDQFERLRPILDDVFKRANEVGLDVDYRANFFPRSFKQDAATKKAAMEFFESNARDVLEEAYQNFRTKMGRDPFEEERWKIINNLMRGFRQEGITLSKTGSLKRRVLDQVTEETADFYTDSFSALQNYFDAANNLIEARRFFGKELGVDLKKVAAETDFPDIAGVAIDKLVTSGKLKPGSAQRLRDILDARFRGGQMNGWLLTWKNASYISLMGDLFSALTQIGDFEKTMYRAGLREGAPAVWNAVFNPTKQEVRLADLGLDRTISAEFSTASATSRAVNTVFRVSGLSWVDRLGKESYINGTLSRYRRAIAETDEDFLAGARRILGNEADETFDAIRRGEATDNVKFLMTNELADFFPVTLEEVPIAYLKSPNGRIFYTMKTFTTKQLNNYYREIIRQAATDKVQAAKNAARLISFFVAMNMTAGEIKDFISGREKPLRDKVVDNMLRVIGFGKYQLDRTQQQGLARTLVETILPPTTLFDDITLDAFAIAKDTGAPLRSVRNIPLGGELYYWWFGRGVEIKERESKESGGRGSGSSVIPSVTIPSVVIPSITIPGI